jgi:putative colanic acid biosynthesis UDP-glucose lipid carrier transferase
MGIIARHQTPFRVVQRLTDPVVVAGTLWALAAFHGVAFGGEWRVLALLTGFVVATVFEAAGVYRPWRARPIREELNHVILAWLAAATVLFGLGWATDTLDDFPQHVLLQWMVAAPVALVLVHGLVRLVLRQARERGRNLKSYVVVGGGDLGRRLHEQMTSHPWLGMRGLGWFDDRAPADGHGLPIPYLGSLDALAEFVERESPHYVYIALPANAEPLVREALDALADSTASVYLVPDIFTFELLNARTEHIEGLPVIGLRESPFTGVEGSLKRAEDLVLASLILVLVSPLMLAIALAVKLTSRGPVLFKQRRYGLDGCVIRVYKFRTMTVCEDGDRFVQATRFDARVTPLGAFLRRTSLDELPQFFNVLQGRMSIVGPRPHPTALNEQYRKLIKGYMLRHKVRPGITGLAQVNGFRGETDTLEKMERRVQYDLEYIQGWSLELDLKIIARTVVKGFRNENAY